MFTTERYISSLAVSAQINLLLKVQGIPHAQKIENIVVALISLDCDFIVIFIVLFLEATLNERSEVLQ